MLQMRVDKQCTSSEGQFDNIAIRYISMTASGASSGEKKEYMSLLGAYGFARSRCEVLQ